MCIRDSRWCSGCRGWECQTPGSYQLPIRTALLQFNDTAYAGAEVTIALNLRYEVLAQLESAIDPRGALYLFGEHVLESWNLTNDGRPLPADGYHFSQQPADFCTMVIDSWREQISPTRVREESVMDPLTIEEKLGLDDMVTVERG